MKVLITGGAGYIGSHTAVELLDSGYEIIIIDNFFNSDPQVIQLIQRLAGKPFRYYSVDCCDLQSLHEVFSHEEDIEAVIHFAAHKAVGESVERPLKYYDNNLNALLSILQAMEDYGIKNLIFSSSCTVYGNVNLEQLPIAETTPIQPPTSPYGYTKQVCEMIIQHQAESTKLKLPEYSLKSVLLRYFNPIGAHPSGKLGEFPQQFTNNVVPVLMEAAFHGTQNFKIFGNDYNTPDGTCIRDFIHICDLAKAHVSALQWLCAQESTNFHEVFNAGTGKGHSVLEVVQTLEKVANTKIHYSFAPRRTGDIEQIYSDAQKAQDLLQWQAQFSLEDALAHAWQWQQNLYRDQRFEVLLIQSETDQEKAFAIRRQVFVEEQNVSPEEEYDTFESTARHFLVIDLNTQQACGTARWRFTDSGIKLERFAVLASFRSQGVGSVLVEKVLQDIAQHPRSAGKLIYLHAQVTAMGLYHKFGFQPIGNKFLEANIEHYKMILPDDAP